MKFTQSPAFIMGETGEKAAAKLLKQRGYWIIESYEFSGRNDDKPPRMKTANMELVIPDLDISKDGRRMWVEVKTKTSPSNRNGYLEHGIPLRHYNDYQRVEAITACPVWLFIIEQATSTYVTDSIANLKTTARLAPNAMTTGGMVFWKRESFRYGGKISQIRQRLDTD